MKKIGTLAVIGVGLIGGSFALALKQQKKVGRVIGAGRSRANLNVALKSGVIDEIAANAADAVRGADLVLIAVPVSQFASVLEKIRPHLAPHTVVTDAGSTKQDVVAAARRILKSRFSQFVPGHPIAGTENSGAGAAFASLFEGNTVILTPGGQTAPGAVRLVSAAWRQCGAHLQKMKPAEHDELFGLVSHLPHMISFALVNQIAGSAGGAKAFENAGGGLRDMSRIAASSPEMWRDIAFANQKVLVRLLDIHMRQVKALRDQIAHRKASQLHASLRRASATRRSVKKWL